MLHDVLHIPRLSLVGICVHRRVSAFLRPDLLATGKDLQSQAVSCFDKIVETSH